MQPSFLFYDYETFGISPAFDRPAQFAGIRTDLNLNPIAAPVNIYCRPAPFYLPDPEAILITHITPQLCQQKGLKEAAFAKEIHAQLAAPNTCSLGYNSIRFDDEFNRFLFYRNFYDPYEYSYKNDNSRWDLIDLVRACYALRPEGINWPIDEQGLPSFKLEALTKANHLEHENAHDALSDVYATIAIAKLIKEKQPRIFDYFYQLRQKKAVKALIDKNGFQPLVHVSGMFGARRANLSLVLILTALPHQPNAVIALDLMGDLTPLLTLSSAELRQRLYTKAQDRTEEETPLPVKLIHLNKAPILAPLNVLRPEDQARLNLNIADYREKAKWVHAHFAHITSVLLEVFDPSQEDAAFTQKKQQAQQEDVFCENQLYARFFSTQDKFIFEKIRNTPFDALEFLNIETNDPRIKPLLLLYKFQNAPQFLTPAEQQTIQTLIAKKWDETAIQHYLQNLQNLMTQHQNDKEKLTLLQQLWYYCRQVFAE